MGTAQVRPFGATADGASVDCWTLSDGQGMSAEILTLGGAVRSLLVPAPGGVRDVVLGFDGVAGYERHADTCMGALAGRVAGRIAGAAFSLDGRDFALSPSQPPNCLHGGFRGFHHKVWDARPNGDGSLTLDYESPDGEEGFPGTLRCAVTYALGGGALSITYEAASDAPTLVNLTNHSYFNLSGEATVAEHWVRVSADAILEGGTGSIPTGRLMDVSGTPFDLRAGALLGPGLESGHPQLRAARGYDHCFVLGREAWTPPRTVAAVEASGLRLDCETTQPGLVLYTANYLDLPGGKGGRPYAPRAGVCLEAQNWPDAVHHPDFPSSVLRPGERYAHTARYRFSAV